MLNSNTVRYTYRARGGVDKMDIYIPLLSLPKNSDGQYPDNLMIIIKKSHEPSSTVGYKNVKIKLPFGHYEFPEEGGRSVKYYFVHDNQKYNLYVPKSIYEIRENCQK